MNDQASRMFTKLNVMELTAIHFIYQDFFQWENVLDLKQI